MVRGVLTPSSRFFTPLEQRDVSNVECTEAAVCLALRRLGLTFKKTIHAAEQDRNVPGVIRRLFLGESRGSNVAKPSGCKVRAGRMPLTRRGRIL